MIRKLSKREQYIFAICVTLIVLYAGKKTVWGAFNMKRQERRLEMMKTASTIREYHRIIEENGDIAVRYGVYAGELRQQHSDEEEMSVFLSAIDAKAGAFGLHVSDLKPRRTKNDHFYNEFSAGLSLTGEWIPLMQFLHTLQQSPYFLKIVELQIEKDTRPRGALRCRLALSRVLLTRTVE